MKRFLLIVLSSIFVASCGVDGPPERPGGASLDTGTFGFASSGK